MVRSQERWAVEPPSEAARALNYRYQALSYRLTDKLMAPFLVEIPPDDAASVPFSAHAGEEFLFVLAGQLRVTIEEDEYHLAPGDSIYFDSRLDHSLRAAEGGLVRLLACVAQDPSRGGSSEIGDALQGGPGTRSR